MKLEFADILQWALIIGVIGFAALIFLGAMLADIPL
jgi:hypothetical protein